MTFDRTADDYYQDELMRISRVSPISGSEAFLITTKQKAVLVDSGFAFCADKMIENIRAVLGARPLDFILLTHSHYDHASGTGRCRLAYKGLKVIASEYAAKILSKPSAISVISELNGSAAGHYGAESIGDKLGDLGVDITVRDGDVIDLGDISLQVIEAVGHTKCCISFYVPQNRMLISCETLGACADEHSVAPGFLVSYEASINYIKRLLDMDIDLLHIPHFGLLRGDSCREFIKRALSTAESLKDFIISGHLQGKTDDEIIEHYKDAFYDELLQSIQPVQAFYLNASHIVPMVIKEVLK